MEFRNSPSSMEWRNHLPNYKKGGRLNCNNYRPITLLNLAYKIYAILLNNRLSEITENKLGDFQMGFRLNRSTIDNNFMVRQTFEKCHKYNIELHNIFVDYSQAFDSINRNKITECLMKYEVPKKLIKLIGLTLTNTIAKVKIGNQFTNEFRIVSGVKQGDPLSATLFSIVIDYILKQLDFKRKYISTHKAMLCLCRRHTTNHKNDACSRRYLPKSKRNINTVWVDHKWA